MIPDLKMKFLYSLERRFGRYAIRNLPTIIIGLYAAGYLLMFIAPQILGYLTLDPVYILQGQVWRLVTWIIVPPGRMDIFTIIMLLFYFSLARSLERTWGSFLFNFYYFSGMIFSVIGAFLLYAYYASGGFRYSFGALFSTYYINMSMLLAFAMSYPDAEVLLYFVIPIKMKWLGLLDGVLILYSFFQTGLPGKVAIAAAMLNFIIFFLLTRSGKGAGSFRQSARKAQFKKAFDNARRQNGKAGTGGSAGRSGMYKDPNGKIAIHRCAQCGRTELDSDSLEFRYCSKCNGAYEYCQDHLFTHTHRQ